MTEKISLVIPAKNEVESLNKVLNEIQGNDIIGEVIVIVDSKNDSSIDIAKKFNCKIIVQNKKGYGSAIIEGFKNVSCNFGCIFNADFSFDPKYLNEMAKKAKFKNFIFKN